METSCMSQSMPFFCLPPVSTIWSQMRSTMLIMSQHSTLFTFSYLLRSLSASPAFGATLLDLQVALVRQLTELELTGLDLQVALVR